MSRLSLAGLGALLAAAAFSPTARAQQGASDGPVLYVTQYRIQQSRLDSLASLVRTYDVPWHAAISARIPGYQRFFYRHDTGDEYNFVIATVYPNWDMIRGDEIPFDEIWERFKRDNRLTDADGDRVDELFRWAYEGSSHVDNIYRPITAEDGD